MKEYVEIKKKDLRKQNYNEKFKKEIRRLKDLS